MKRFSSIRNYANEKKIHDDNHKKWLFLPAKLEPNTLICWKKISENSRAYFHFSTKALQIRSDVLFKGNIGSKVSIN